MIISAGKYYACRNGERVLIREHVKMGDMYYWSGTFCRCNIRTCWADDGTYSPVPGLASQFDLVAEVEIV